MFLLIGLRHHEHKTDRWTSTLFVTKVVNHKCRWVNRIVSSSMVVLKRYVNHYSNIDSFNKCWYHAHNIKLLRFIWCNVGTCHTINCIESTDRRTLWKSENFIFLFFTTMFAVQIALLITICLCMKRKTVSVSQTSGEIFSKSKEEIFS